MEMLKEGLSRDLDGKAVLGKQSEFGLDVTELRLTCDIGRKYQGRG